MNSDVIGVSYVLVFFLGILGMRFVVYVVVVFDSCVVLILNC